MSALDITPAITELDEEQSWELLATAEYGRLAIVIGGAPEIFPVNVAATRRTVYFRTAEGTKLLGAAIGHPVAFEADRADAAGAWSVVLKGVPRQVTAQAELDEVDAAGLRTWVANIKRHVVAIDVETLTGRRFDFTAEPEDDTIHATD